MKFTRRVAILSLPFLIGGLVPSFSAQSITSELMEPAGIADMFFGNKGAPATLIVYSSPTCSHCISFDGNVLPVLKEKYVDRGRLRISVRPFVLSAIDVVIFLVAEKSGEDRYHQTVAAYIDSYDELMQSNDREALMRKIATSQGIDKAAFDEAVANQAYLIKLNELRNQAVSKFGVEGTPTFFLNGERFAYDGTLASFERALDSLD